MDMGMTQFMGSQSQQPIMLQQPPFEVIGKQVFRRSGRGRETQYLIRFIGEMDAEVFVSRKQLLDAQDGREAMAAFEADLAPQHPGLQDNEDDMGSDVLYSDNLPAPGPAAGHMPWTQQPSEAQLPQTQQEFSPNMDKPSQPHQDEPMPFGNSRRLQKPQPQEPYTTGTSPTVRGAQQGGKRIVNGLDASLWEDPLAYMGRHQVHNSPPYSGHLSGVPAAPSNTFAHMAAQSRGQPHLCTLRQEHLPLSQALQPNQRSSHAYIQPQNFESPAARAHTCYDTRISDHAAQEQWRPQQNLEGMPASMRGYNEPSLGAQVSQDEQRSASPYGQPQPQGVSASLAALSRSHHEDLMTVRAPEEGWRHVPPQAQHQPRNTFASLAARSRHLNERRQPSNTAPGQPVSGQTALTGNQTGGSSLVHGVMLRQDVPQHHQSEWMDQQVPTGNPGGGQDAQEASFSFAPAGVPMTPREASPSHMPLHNSTSPAHRAPAQQPQSQRGRPVPASCQSVARTWQAHAHQHAAPALPVLQQQAGAARQPRGIMEQSSIPHAGAASVRTQQAPQRAATEAQPVEQAQAGKPGFYDTILQKLSTGMDAHAPSLQYAWASRAPVIAQAPSMPQGQHEPGRGRATQTGAEDPSPQSMPLEAHPALSTAPAPARTALPAHHSGRAEEPQQGVEYREPVHSSDDAADTDDAVVALAALEQEAAQRIRAQSRQKSVPPAEGQGTQLPYVSAPAWGAWVPAIQQMVLSKSAGKEGEAMGPAADVAEDPIEGGPAPPPLQQQPLAAAAQEMRSPSTQGRARQHDHLKPAHVSTMLDKAEKGPPEKLRRLIKKAAEAMIVEAAARADDSETGSSAERFTAQAFRPRAGEEGPVDTPLQDAEPAGNREQAECQEPGAAVDLTRGETPIPDSAAESAGTPDNAEDDLLMRRLSKEGWKGAVIKRAKRQLGDNGEDELEVQILWPDDFSAWVDRIELHMRPHTHLTLIKFYESKTRAK